MSLEISESKSGQKPEPGLGTWQFDEQAEGRKASLWLAHATEEERRRLYHDYIAAVRTLRYLAQKGLKTLPPDPAKEAAFEKHLRSLESLQVSLIDPLFQRPQPEPRDAP